ncbi:hypothetical protein [Segatella paludivivens]|uniref:hypothetical protein n=1 Tax=Segatella paludivivens TaxID=185294 RepID=UPI000373A682|nr:hypothetical protein [Segatella paludivivens]
MKKIFIFVISCIAAMTVSTSCKMAPSDNPGDTVAASVFEPVDTSVHAAKSKNDTTNIKNIKDSIDIFFVGDGSTKHNLQLVSYPSKRDTATYYKGKHLKVTGNADFGHVVRIGFYHLPTGDSIVTSVTEVK